MPSWTPADIPDLTGRVAVVTGANSGLGLETTRALVTHGATVVMACRDADKCRDAAEKLHAEVPSAHLETASLDLADLDSVATFAEDLKTRHSQLDLLINNAGVMAPPHRLTTKQGFELQFGVNHLGHFALTGRLMSLLVGRQDSRIVTVSSFAHVSGAIDFDDLQREHHYTPYGAYSASKLANLLFMLELERHLRQAGAETISVGAHPGLVSTNLQAAGPFLGNPRLTSWLVLAGVRVIGQTAAHGAVPQLCAATSTSARGGDYYGPDGRHRGQALPATMSARARDERVAERLWATSKELTGVDIDAALAEADRSLA